MAVPSYDSSRIQPGYDQAEVESCLESFFDQLARQYPDRVITWSTWDHENWDRPAKHLCRALGYSRGKELFNAFGYDVVDPVAKETRSEQEGTTEVQKDTPDEVTEISGREARDESGESEEPEDMPEDEETVPGFVQKGVKRRKRNRITLGQILFILLFLATAFGVYWIVKFG